MIDDAGAVRALSPPAIGGRPYALDRPVLSRRLMRALHNSRDLGPLVALALLGLLGLGFLEAITALAGWAADLAGVMTGGRAP